MDNTWRLIPKSKPTFQKISSENFKFKKKSQHATILAILFGHFPGVLAYYAEGIPNLSLGVSSNPGGSFEGISGVLGRFQPFFQLFRAEFSDFSMPNFSDLANVEQHISGQNPLNRNHREDAHVNPRPSCSNYDTALKNVTNLRGQVDPEEDRSSQNSQSNGHTNLAVPPYQLNQEPMLPSVGNSVLFLHVRFFRLILTFPRLFLTFFFC